LLARNEIHFCSSPGRPFTIAPLYDKFGYAGTNSELGNAILDGNLDLSDLDLDETSKKKHHTPHEAKDTANGRTKDQFGSRDICIQKMGRENNNVTKRTTSMTLQGIDKIHQTNSYRPTSSQTTARKLARKNNDLEQQRRTQTT